MAYSLKNTPYRYARQLAPVDPVIDATTIGGTLAQIAEFMARRTSFTAGVGNTQSFPFSAVCRLVRTFPGSSQEFKATGFYIADDLIVTSAHVLWKNGSLPTTTVVEPGRNGSFTFPTFTADAAEMEVHPMYRSGANPAYDIGVMRVTTPPPNGHYFSLVNQSPAPDRPLAVTGYASGTGVDNDYQHFDIDRVRRLSRDGENVDYNLQTLGGTSGSPAFLDFDAGQSGADTPAEMPVMGVHRGPGVGSQHNQAVLLTPEKIEWLRGGGRMSMAQSLSYAPRTIGGLPLIPTKRDTIGGLPLLPARQQSLTLQLGRRSQSFARNWIVTDTNGGMSVANRTFGHPTHDLSGKTMLTVRVPNMPDGGSVRWHIPDANDRTKVMFELPDGSTGVSVSGTSVTLCALSGGHAAVDCMVKDASGTTVESNKYLVSAPQFVLVALDPTIDSYLSDIGLDTRAAAVRTEIAAMLRHLYRDVNIRFVMPGDTLPTHLGLASDPTYPGGVQTMPSVFYLHLVGDEGFRDDERSRVAGTHQGYAAGLIGRNHGVGEMDPPMHEHALSRILMHRFGSFFPDMTPIEAGLTAGTFSPADTDLAATLWGRVGGYIAGHELGHFMLNQLFGHDPAGGLMGGGSGDIARVSGMTATGATGPIVTDGGRAASSGLSVPMRRTFENELAVNPPLDAAGRRDRGRVGSFSVSTMGRRQGFVNADGARSLSGETIHLPGATVLDGWEATAFVAGLQAAITAAMVATPGTMIFAPFATVDNILDACDSYGVTLGLGVGLTAGVGAGFGGGVGLVFAPGRRIGFYGSRADVMGWIASGSLSAQMTLIKGGPEVFGGNSMLVGVAVETIGWFDAGLIGMPIGAHMIVTDAGPVGATFEFGIGVGVPVVSLVEAFAQDSTTVTTFGLGHSATSRPQPTHDTSDARAATIASAIQAGASPQDAAAFADSLFR